MRRGSPPSRGKSRHGAVRAQRRHELAVGRDQVRVRDELDALGAHGASGASLESRGRTTGAPWPLSPPERRIRFPSGSQAAQASRERHFGEQAKLPRPDRQKAHRLRIGRGARDHQPFVGREAHPESRAEPHRRGAVGVSQKDGALFAACLAGLVEEDLLSVAARSREEPRSRATRGRAPSPAPVSGR